MTNTGADHDINAESRPGVPAQWFITGTTQPPCRYRLPHPKRDPDRPSAPDTNDHRDQPIPPPRDTGQPQPSLLRRRPGFRPAFSIRVLLAIGRANADLQ